jgi:hypothetical protein
MGGIFNAANRAHPDSDCLEKLNGYFLAIPLKLGAGGGVSHAATDQRYRTSQGHVRASDTRA